MPQNCVKITVKIDQIEKDMDKGNRFFGLLLFVSIIMNVELGEARNEIDLSKYQWENRLLMVFAPSAQHAGYQNLTRELEGQTDEIIDRDLLVFHVFEIGKSRISETVISKRAAESLQRRFSIAPGQITVVLIGKDGGEKLRRETTVDLNEIFSLIDSMPMRQREMRERGKK